MAETITPDVASANDFVDSLLGVRYLLNEATAGFWSDAQLTYYLETAAAILSAQYGAYQSTGTVTLTTSTTSYTKPTDIVRIDAVTYAGRALQRMKPNMLGRDDLSQTTAGPPYYYLLHGTTIVISPAPTSSENNQTLTVYGWKVTDDPNNIHEAFQPAMLYLAAAMAKRQDKKLGEAVAFDEAGYAIAARSMNNLIVHYADARVDSEFPNTNQTVAR